MPYHISSGSVRAESRTVDKSRLDVTEFMDSFCTQNLMFDLTPVHYYSGFRLKRCQTSAEARHLYLSIPFPEKYEHYNQLAMYTNYNLPADRQTDVQFMLLIVLLTAPKVFVSLQLFGGYFPSYPLNGRKTLRAVRLLA